MSAETAPVQFPSSALPETVPIFPLPGAVLLPRGRLPLNIFEPRYVAMVNDALADPSRLIGMIQPNAADAADPMRPAVYRIGCAGRIVSFSETDDGRYLIGLAGVCRFAVAEEIPGEGLYRRVVADWQDFLTDLGRSAEEPEIDRRKLLAALKPYFKMQGISADWNAIENTPSDMLVSSLTMICPLAPNEKQALLEARDLHARADLLTALLTMAAMPQSAEQEAGVRH